MSNKGSLRLIAILSVAAFSLLTAPAVADELGRGTSVDDWKGFNVLKGGKGYAETPMGQVHYRDLGPRSDRYALLLLHQTPMSMIQWAGIQNILVERGYRVITVDTPGYGLSDPPARQPSIRDFADNLVHVLDQLKLEKVVIGGHHTGAHIAVSFTANHPEHVVGLVLHGAAPMNAEEADNYIRGARALRPRTPTADGSHLTFRFPPPKPGQKQGPQRQELLDARTWNTIGAFIQGPDIGHWAAFRYDMLPDVSKIKVPTILLTDTNDPVNAMDKRLAGLRPDFKYVEFSQGGSLEFMAEPERWANIYVDWRAKSIK